MKKLYLLLLLIIIIMTGACSSGANSNGELKRIDSLINRDSLTFAYREIEKVQAKDLRDTRDSAYYFLLKTKVMYELYMPIGSTKIIDYSIEFYNHHHDSEEKLAEALYHKASILHELGNVKEAVVCLKSAEYLVEKTDNINLKHKIYKNFVILNEEADEHKIALEYAKKNLRISLSVQKPFWIAHAYNDLIVSYNELGQPDSARLYLQKSIDLLPHIPRKERIYILNNIGAHLIPTNPKKAEEYFLQVLEIEPLEAAKINLAYLYALKGNVEQAEDIWKKALNTNDFHVRNEVLHSLFHSQLTNRKYQEATQTAKELVELTDSLSKAHDENNIIDIQQEFDKMKATQDYEQRIGISLFVIVLLSLLFIIVLLYSRYKTSKAQGILAKDQMLIRGYESQISELKRQKQGKEKEIETLTRKREQLIDKHRDILSEGHKLYTDILESNETTIMWKRKDFECFIEYYRLVNAEFVDHLEQAYKGLSPKYKFLLILEHLDKDRKEIMRIMAFAEGSLRSAKSRINKHSIESEMS